MMSIRAIARVAPRAVLRSAKAPSSQYLLRQTIRPSLLSSTNSAWQNATPRAAAAFSTSQRQLETESQVNDELAAKLESELAMEKEMRDAEAMPAHIQEYLDNSPFKIVDKQGTEEVVMTRTFGDESIRISFSIDDLNNVDEDPDQMDEDNSMIDEMDDPADLPIESAQSGGANTKGSVNRGRTSTGNMRVAPADGAAPGDRAELQDEEDSESEGAQEPSFPAHVNITVNRPGKGALQIEAIAQDGLMVIDNVYYYKDAKLADPESIDSEWATRDLYTGPPFGNLDEDLQVLFERYLDERGINTNMALFVPEYIDYKEQREYLAWLQGVKGFVE